MVTTVINSVQGPNRTPPGAGPALAANPAPAVDFATALSRLAYASLTSATLVRPPDFPDPRSTLTPQVQEPQPQPAPEQASASEERIRPDRPERIDPEHDEASTVSKSDPDDTESAEIAPSDDPFAQAISAPIGHAFTPAGDATPTPGTQAAIPAVPTGQAPPARFTLQQAAAQPIDPDPTAPDTQQQPQRHDPPGRILKAQILDGVPKDQIPQIAHTLTSRAAVALQSGTTRPGLGQDGGETVAQNQQQAASAQIAGAAQNAATGAQKSKVASRTGASEAKTGTQNTATAATQSATPQTGQEAIVPPALRPAALASSPLNAGAARGSMGEQASLSGRGDPFTLAGDGARAAATTPRTNAAPPAEQPRPALPARVVANQVAVQIQKAFGQGNDRISIQLRPAELGRVEVRLDVATDGRVTAVITADRADTLDMLQRDARFLQNALQDAGLQADSNSLSFELKGQNHTADNARNGAAANGQTDPETVGTSGDGPGAIPRSDIVTRDHVDIQV